MFLPLMTDMEQVPTRWWQFYGLLLLGLNCMILPSWSYGLEFTISHTVPFLVTYIKKHPLQSILICKFVRCNLLIIDNNGISQSISIVGEHSFEVTRFEMLTWVIVYIEDSVCPSPGYLHFLPFTGTRQGEGSSLHCLLSCMMAQSC